MFGLAITSCGLEEPYGGLKNNEGVIEFVARPISYNKQKVATKAGADAIEDAIYNAFLLIFDSNGDRILVKEVTDFTTTPSTTIPIDKGLSEVTACYLINVPHSFAKGITKIEMPEDATEEFIAENYNSYLNTAVLEGIKYKTGTPMGVPMVDIDNSSSTPDVACIPMFGKEIIDLHNESGAQQINVQRLFAKVTVNLTMNLDLDDWTQELVQTGTYYQLNSYTLYNLPNKVKLTQTTELNSDWIRDPSSFEYVGTSEKPGNGSGILNTKIYNNKYVSNNTEIEFSFYAPEYFLDSGLTEGNQKLKPIYSPSGSYPIYLSLNGTYCQYSVTSAQMYHKVYFGRNETCDFTIERNKNYINYLTIAGTNCNEAGEGENLDHRVSTEYINNPVAENGVSANCYIIGQAGDYAFPAYKGAYNDLTQAVLCGGSAESTLEEIANDNSSNIQLTNLKYDADKNIVSFTVSKISDGNVVIALKNPDGSTEWSWHLWCKAGSSLDIFGWGEMSTQTYPNGYVFMDRNLGAIPSIAQTLNPEVASGLYYRYGRKEPFINGSYAGDGNNGAYSWNSTNGKSVYDPCPPGYMVPPQAAWASESVEPVFTHNTSVLGNTFEYWDGVKYPYTYYLQGNSLVEDTAGYVEKSYPNQIEINTDIDIDVRDWGISNSVANAIEKAGFQTKYHYDGIPFTRYRNIVLELDLTGTSGRLWTRGDTHLYFYNATLNVSITDLLNLLDKMKIISGEVSKNNYKYDIKVDTKYGVIVTGIRLERKDNWSNFENFKDSDLSLTDKGTLMGKIFTSTSLIESTYATFTTFDDNRNDDKGLQIRCLLE